MPKLVAHHKSGHRSEFLANIISKQLTIKKNEITKTVGSSKNYIGKVREIFAQCEDYSVCVC